jgi:hypothetical protein
MARLNRFRAGRARQLCPGISDRDFLGDLDRIGDPLFFCRTIAQSSVSALGAMSLTRTATTAPPRNLLSMARLNSARSRVRPSSCNFVRIDQTWLARNVVSRLSFAALAEADLQPVPSFHSEPVSAAYLESGS